MRSGRLSGRRRRRGRVCWVGCVLCHGVCGEAVLRQPRCWDRRRRRGKAAGEKGAQLLAGQKKGEGDRNDEGWVCQLVAGLAWKRFIVSWRLEKGAAEREGRKAALVRCQRVGEQQRGWGNRLAALLSQGRRKGKGKVELAGSEK